MPDFPIEGHIYGKFATLEEVDNIFFDKIGKWTCSLVSSLKKFLSCASKLYSCFIYRAFQVACNWAMSCRSSHVIKLNLSIT